MLERKDALKAQGCQVQLKEEEARDSDK